MTDRPAFSIPFNGEPGFFEELTRQQEILGRTESMYVAPNPSLNGSGRKPKIGSFIRRDGEELWFDEKSYDEMLVALISKNREIGIKTLILLNGAFLPGDPSRFGRYVETLYKEHGISGVIVSRLDIMDCLGLWRSCPGLEIHSSVHTRLPLMEDPRSVDRCGIDVLLIPPDFQRDLKTVEWLRQNVRAKLKIMVNEGCLRFCKDRRRHHEFDSSYPIARSLRDLAFDQAPDLSAMTCRGRFSTYPEEILKSNWIRPEELPDYQGLVDSIKIVGRSYSTPILFSVIRAYHEQSYSGDLRHLVEVFKHVRTTLDYSNVTPKMWSHVRACELSPGSCPKCRESGQALVGGGGERGKAIFPL